MQKSFRRDFKRNIKKGEDKGIDWSKADLISYTADSSLVSEDGMNTTMLRGKIYFKAAGKDYFLAFDEVIWFENKGWYGVSLKRIDEKNKEIEDDRKAETDREDMMRNADSAYVADSTAKAIEMQAEGVRKQPVKNKPVKNKTQAPIRKPE